VTKDTSVRTSPTRQQGSDQTGAKSETRFRAAPE